MAKCDCGMHRLSNGVWIHTFGCASRDATPTVPPDDVAAADERHTVVPTPEPLTDDYMWSVLELYETDPSATQLCACLRYLLTRSAPLVPTGSGSASGVLEKCRMCWGRGSLPIIGTEFERLCPSCLGRICAFGE